MRYLSLIGALGSYAGVAPEFSEAQGADHAVLYGTVVDPTGAVVPGAVAHLAPAALPAAPTVQERETDGLGEFSFSAEAGTYVLTVEAPGFGVYTSPALALKPNARVRMPVHLAVAGIHEQVDILDDEAGGTDGNGLAGALVFEGENLKLLSNDTATLQQELSALAGGMGTPNFVINGFSGGRLPPKSSIRSIRIISNNFSAAFSDYTLGRVEISTKPGADKLHGTLDFSGTDQPLDARDPYTPLPLPFYDFQQDGNLNGPVNRKTSFFISDAIESLANNAAVNAANPLDPSTTISEGLPAPQRTDTFSVRLDRQFSDRNFGYIRDEWSQTRILNSGINPLVLPAAAFTSDTLTNALQLADTQTIGAHAVNEVRFQYLRTRVRQDPNSTSPSVVVQSAFQDGGSPFQVLRDNQDAYELQELLDVDHGKHALRAGFRFHGLRDANESSAGFNGQYIFPDVASYLAGQPSQFSITTGQQGAVLFNEDLAVYAEDEWKVSPNFTLTYGLRFESESAIPDHSDPAPRIGFTYGVRPGKHKAPIVTLRGGYGVFYDRFPAAQLLQAIRQNGVREVAYIAQGTSFNPNGPPPGVPLSATQPTIYQVNPALRSSYGQIATFSVLRSLGRFGNVSGNLMYEHNTHNFLTRNINAPLPGTFDPATPGSGVRPLGNTANIYQFSSDANGNLERFYVNYRVHLGSRLFGFGRLNFEKNYGESEGIDHFPSDQYNLRADYGRLTIARPVLFTGGFTWSLPHDFEVSPFLDARSGIPFDITTGTDLNGDTIYNDRPSFAAGPSQGAVVQTAFGTFNTSPGTSPPIPRNYGTSPGLVWLDIRVAKGFHVGPRPQASVATAGSGASQTQVQDRPWDLRFEVEAQNPVNHNNPGVPVGVLGVAPCAAGQACTPVPSAYFGHSLSLSNDFSPNTASNRTIFLRTTFTF